MKTIYWFMLLLVLLVGCSRSDKPEPAVSVRPKIQLLLNWFPEGQHGGYIAAAVEGYYAEEGLDVVILPGGPGASVAQRVGTGVVEFGVENADNAVIARSAGVPVVALLAPLQTSPRCLMVHAKSPITSFEQIQNVTLSMGSSGAFSHYLRAKLPLTGVQIIPYGGSIAPFLHDPNMVMQGYVFSEPILAKREGVDTRTLLLSDFGFNPYTSCLLVSGDYLQKNPEIVTKMVRASIRGWTRYLESQEASHAEIVKLNPNMDREALKNGDMAMAPLILTPDSTTHGIGFMDVLRWQTLIGQLEELKLIPQGSVKAETMFVVAPDQSTPSTE